MVMVRERGGHGEGESDMVRERRTGYVRESKGESVSVESGHLHASEERLYVPTCGVLHHVGGSLLIYSTATIQAESLHVPAEGH